MTKGRDPQTFAGAVRQVIEVIGAAAAAAAAGRSERTVYEWADPDSDVLPNLRQALEMDIAYSRGGHGRGPVLQVYLRTLDRETDGGSRAVGDLLCEWLDLDAAHGLGAAALKQALAPESEGGRRLTESERQQLKGKVAAMRRELDDVDDALAALDVM